MSELGHLIAGVAAWLDERLPHTHGWMRVPGRKLICGLAEVGYGWGPGASDWAKATRAERWLHRVLAGGNV